MNSFQLNSLVRIKNIEQVKKRRLDKPLYSLNSSDCYANLSVMNEITGKIKEIKNKEYVILLGNCVDGKFMPSGKKMTFTESYMTMFARPI